MSLWPGAEAATRARLTILEAQGPKCHEGKKRKFPPTDQQSRQAQQQHSCSMNGVMNVSEQEQGQRAEHACKRTRHAAHNMNSLSDADTSVAFRYR